MAERPAIFLDRDGTIIVERDYLSDPALVELEQGAAAALRDLADRGWPLFVVSNQSGVGRGYFGMAEVEAVNRRMIDLLGEEGVRIEAIYVCPHAPGEGCDCRKPAPGLLLQAAREHGLDLVRSFMIGDKRSDLEAADRAGATGILVTSGHGDADRAWASAGGYAIAADLCEAAALIVQQK